MGELIVNGVKWAFIIGIALVFMSAIDTIISLVTIVASNNILAELFGMVSCVLPFSLSLVVSALLTVFNAILSFKVAKKIYYLTSEHIKI